MQRKLFVLIFAIFSMISMVFAGTTGKITGLVLDNDTGDPLIGVNVMLAGTSMGAATDLEGYFTILNVAPGIYEVVATSIGYKTSRIKDIRISVDHTTNIDINMESSVIEGEEVVVVAQKELIQKGLTSSESSISEDELEAMPVESFTGLLATQAGVTQGSDGALHVRGGRASEVTYMVDGIPVSSDLGLSLSTNVISELTLISGTFNAEYGKAMSGIVNIATKEGAKKFKSRLTTQFGDMLTWNDTYIKGNEFNPLKFQRYDLDLSGPISFLPEGSYFITGTFRNNLGWLYGIREHTTYDYAMIGNNNATVLMTGDSAYVPMNTSNSEKIMAKLAFKPFGNTKLMYQFIGDFGEWQNYEHRWMFAPDGRYQYHSNDMMHALHLTQTVNEKTYFTLKYSYKTSHSEQYVNKIEIPFTHDEDLNGNGVIDIIPGLNVSEDLNGNGTLDTDLSIDWDFINQYGAFIPNDTWYSLAVGDSTINVPYYVQDNGRTDVPAYHFYYGGQSMGYYISEDKSHTVKFDFTSQVTREHQIRTGFEFNAYERHRNSSVLQMSEQVSDIPPFIQNSRVANHDYYTHNPYDFSAYIQDKIEVKDIIIQAGLRYDYFNANTVSIDPLTRDTTNASPKNQISPRLGVSFPITDQGFIHFSYGHFFQMPSFYYLYTNPLLKQGASVSRFGNPDIDPQKTVMYELGLQQQLSPSTAIDLTVFYRDILNWLSTEYNFVDNTYKYTRYITEDYGNVRGITFALTQRGGQMLTFNADYTYQIAEGNSSSPDAKYYDALNNVESETKVVPLDWDVRHTINGNLTITPMSDMGIGILGRFSTGKPYTPTVQGQRDAEENSDRKLSEFTVDFKAYKYFYIGKQRISVNLKVYNLLDRANERYVFSDTGRSGYSLVPTYVGDPAEKYPDTPGIHSLEEYLYGPTSYSSPRQILLSIGWDINS